MKKKVAVTIIAILAEIALALAVLFVIHNANQTEKINALTAESSEKSETIETLNADVAEKAGQIEALNADVAKKAGQIETLNAYILEKADQIRSLNADAAEKADRIEILTANVAEKTDQIELLNADVAEKAGQIEKLEADVVESAGLVNTLKADTAEKADLIDQLKADAAEKDGLITKLQATVTENTGLIDTLKADAADKAGQIEKLQAAATENAGLIDTLNADVADKAGQIEKLQAAATENAGLIDTLKKEIAEKTDLIEQYETDAAENAAQLGKLNEATAILKRQEEDLNSMKLLLGEKETALADTSDALTRQRETLAEKVRKIDDLMNLRNSIVGELSSALSDAGLDLTVDPDTGDVSLDSTVFFETAQSEIRQEGRDLLDRFIPVYLDTLLNGDHQKYLDEIIIEGHTNSTGTYDTNLKLSQERALQVALYCLNMPSLSTDQKNVLRQMLIANGRSWANLIYDDNGTEDAEASRRIEFSFSLKDAEIISEINRILQESDE